ncbi:MAG: MBL fold metallo-hydrolase [Nevskiaceae bacterium]
MTKVQAEYVPTPVMIAARQRVFGAENVDPRTGAMADHEVHMVWVSVSTFAVNLAGHVVLFDAYIHKLEDAPNYVPATVQDLIDLAPEYVFLGHGHFDHALDAPAVAVSSGATLVGTQAHCDQAIAQANADIDCIALFQPDEPGGTVRATGLLPGVCTLAVLHQHSAATAPDLSRDPTNVAPPIPNPNSALIHPPGPSVRLETAGDEGGDVLYQFRIGHFALTYHDTAGPMKDDMPEVYDVLRTLPKTDVENGAVVGFNMITNGLRDHAMYIDAVNPKVFVPNHQDFVFEYGAADWIRPALERELQAYSARPEIRWLTDPGDYLKPNYLRFRTGDSRWVDAGEAPCPRGRGAPR